MYLYIIYIIYLVYISIYSFTLSDFWNMWEHCLCKALKLKDKNLILIYSYSKEFEIT